MASAAAGPASYRAARVFVSDLRHFLDMPDDVPSPARRMAEHLSLLVRAATAGDAGVAWLTALPCRRRPGRRPCPGHLAVLRTDIPASVRWQCSSCGDEGVISGWERSPYDLRFTDAAPPADDLLHVVVPADVAATLRGLLLLDTASERVVFRARVTGDGIVLSAGADDLDELLGSVAAEANHEEDRRRQKRLDDAFAMLGDALAEAPPF